MLPTILALTGFIVLILLSDRLGAESRPDFLDPRKKHGPFLSPFRFRE